MERGGKVKSKSRVKNFLLFTLYFLLMTLIAGCGRAREEGIVLWHWMTDRQEAFQQLAKSYEEEVGIKVRFGLYAPSDAYSQKAMAAAQARALPDIYGLLGEKRIFAAFIEAGHVVNLTPYLTRDGWKDIFFKKALAVNEFLPGNEYKVEPGIYGVPIDVMNIQMLYNKDLFAQAGLDPEDPPQTWDEFLACGKRLKEAGIKGMVSGWGETWMIDCFASNYAFNIMGEDKVIATIRGEVPYTDPQWIEVLSLFDQMSKEDVLISGIVTMGNKIAEQLFANERAAFAFNGSWCVNVYKGMNPNLNYGAILPPRVRTEHPMAIWGSAGSSFLVNDRSKNKEEAIKFLRWLTQQPQQVYLAKKTLNLPANKESLGEIAPILAQFADDMDRVTHPNILPVQELPFVIEAFTKGIQAIIIGAMTPEEVAEEVQAVKVREMGKR